MGHRSARNVLAVVLPVTAPMKTRAFCTRGHAAQTPTAVDPSAPAPAGCTAYLDHDHQMALGVPRGTPAIVAQ